MKKVYCKNCKYSLIWGLCNSKKPRKNIYSNSEERLRYPEGYKEKNKFGECKDYQRHWWKFWLK